MMLRRWRGEGKECSRGSKTGVTAAGAAGAAAGAAAAASVITMKATQVEQSASVLLEFRVVPTVCCGVVGVRPPPMDEEEV